MTVLASIATSVNDHGYEAGRAVATDAYAALAAPPSLMIAAISTTYARPEEVVHGIRSKSSAPLIGLFTPGVFTMAGPLGKGVGVLALQTGSLPCDLILEQSPYHQDSTISMLSMTSPRTTLLLAGAAARDDDVIISDSSLLVGVRAPTSIFLNDQTRSDARVAVRFPESLIFGIGLAQLAGATTLDAAAAAAQEALTRLRTLPRAALVFQVGPQSTSSGLDPSEWERIREIVGRTLPILGFGVSTLITPTMGGDRQLLVLTIGSAEEVHSIST